MGSGGQGVLWEARCESLDSKQMNYDHLGCPQTSSRQACHGRTVSRGWWPKLQRPTEMALHSPAALVARLYARNPVELHRGFMNKSNESRLHTYNLGPLYWINLPIISSELDYYARTGCESISTECESRF
jgi:hypothetical protein